jgi:hypothetical protein
MKCEIINFKLFKYHQKVMLQVKLNEMHRAEEKVCCISLKMVSDMMLCKYSGCLKIYGKNVHSTNACVGEVWVLKVLYAKFHTCTIICEQCHISHERKIPGKHLNLFTNIGRSKLRVPKCIHLYRAL